VKEKYNWRNLIDISDPELPIRVVGKVTGVAFIASGLALSTARGKYAKEAIFDDPQPKTATEAVLKGVVGGVSTAGGVVIAGGGVIMFGIGMEKGDRDRKRRRDK
jgi:hypothetical protein